MFLEKGSWLNIAAQRIDQRIATTSKKRTRNLFAITLRCDEWLERGGAAGAWALFGFCFVASGVKLLGAKAAGAGAEEFPFTGRVLELVSL